MFIIKYYKRFWELVKSRLKITNNVTTSSSRIELVIYNYSGHTITTDEAFTLERLEKNGWNENWLDDDAIIITNDIAIEIRAFSSFADIIDLGRQNISLKAGTYRLTKRCDTKSGAEYVSAIFDVSE